MLKFSAVLLTIILFCLPVICQSEELVFPFTIDQKLKNEEMSKFPSDDDIKKDSWFTSPPTRLELLTFIVDRWFSNEFIEFWGQEKNKIENNFDYKSHRFKNVLTDAGVTYSMNKDLFVAYAKISGLGQPIKPMKEVCDDVLNSISISLIGDGYLFQNKFLGPFIQNGSDDPEIIHVVEMLRKNILVVVTLEANFNKQYYFLSCYKEPEKEDIHYQKQSFSINKLP